MREAYKLAAQARVAANPEQHKALVSNRLKNPLLPAMSSEDKRLYAKLRRELKLSREEALAAIAI